MRTLLLIVFLGVCASDCAMAKPAKAQETADDPRVKKAMDAKWLVRVEVLMVQMPQKQALALLPGLRDISTVDESFAKVMAAIEQKLATLVGYPVVRALDGAKATSETILEKRYPAEFDHGTGKEPSAPKKGEGLVDEDLSIPSAFETRNVGVTLEVEARVLGNGDWIYLNVVPQHVTFLGMDGWVPQGQEGGGKAGRFGQPEFATTKTQGDLVVRNGRRVLLGVHTLEKPPGQVEIHILQATTESLAK